MIGVRPGVSEFLADAKYPSQKISFSISPSVGRCCEKKYAKQSQLECKLPVAVFQGRSKNKRHVLQRNDFGNNDWTGKRLSQLLLRRQRTTNENEQINVLHDTNMEEETREEGAGRAETEAWEGRRLPSTLLCRPEQSSSKTPRQGYCPAG